MRVITNTIIVIIIIIIILPVVYVMLVQLIHVRFVFRVTNMQCCNHLKACTKGC